MQCILKKIFDKNEKAKIVFLRLFKGGDKLEGSLAFLLLICVFLFIELNFLPVVFRVTEMPESRGLLVNRLTQIQAFHNRLGPKIKLLF